MTDNTHCTIVTGKIVNPGSIRTCKAVLVYHLYVGKCSLCTNFIFQNRVPFAYCSTFRDSSLGQIFTNLLEVVIFISI